jgi:replicative DNA helicase
VEALMPDLLVIGPVYKMHAGDPNDEPSARTVAQVLDQARDVCGSALLIEAHSPHGNGQGKRPVRPFGSSLWLRWPEFGYGLRLRDDESDADRLRLMDFKAWRGPRDEREWPSRLRAGQSSSGGPVWPWVDDSDTPVEWRAAR